jgi:hypothetical protein
MKIKTLLAIIIVSGMFIVAGHVSADENQSEKPREVQLSPNQTFGDAQPKSGWEQPNLIMQNLSGYVGNEPIPMKGSFIISDSVGGAVLPAGYAPCSGIRTQTVDAWTVRYFWTGASHSSHINAAPEMFNRCMNLYNKATIVRNAMAAVSFIIRIDTACATLSGVAGIGVDLANAIADHLVDNVKDYADNMRKQYDFVTDTIYNYRDGTNPNFKKYEMASLDIHPIKTHNGTYANQFTLYNVG